MASLKIGYWNIHGHTSKLIGDKMLDPEFLEAISGIDIIGIGEIHSQNEISIPGFVSIKQKIREKTTKGPKLAGGIGIFVRGEVSHLVKEIENKNPDSIWVKVKNGNKKGQELYLGTYYVSPDNKNNKKCDFLRNINEEIAHYNKKGQVMIQGDLNGRTGEELDFVEADKFDSDLGLDNMNFENQRPRNSEDRTKNKRGEEILDLCKMNDLMILNGRCTGDIFGKFTCHNWNGSSVVDYCIVPYEYFDSIVSFSVGEYIPWLSDHCMIITSLKLGDISRECKTGEKSFELHPGFLWNDEAYDRYKEALSLPAMDTKINEFLSNNSLSVIEMSEHVKSILFENAEIAKVKCKKKKSDEHFSEPWFDEDCKERKKEIRTLGNKLSKYPENESIRISLREAKKGFRRTIAFKKRNYKKSTLAELESKRKEKNHREFWKIFRKISPKSKREPIAPSMQNFFDYFKNLSVSSRPLEMPENSTSNGPLDYEISLEELIAVGKKTKQGKAVSLDNICNEMLIALITTYPKVLLKLFNAILMSGEVLLDWTTGLIVPIFKDGPKLEPSNYRGITLSSCLSKLFLAVLNNRLIKFVKDNNLLTPSQLGFVLANRTSDAHLIIYNLVQENCHKKGDKIYSCFVDFKKAFDSIPRDVLLKKLLNFGIDGKCFNIIKHIYSSDKACIKSGSTRSDFFGLNLGVRQGCILSPLLFNLFLSDLAKKFESMSEKFDLNHTGINSLFWADDLVLLAKSKEDLDKMLKILEEYCKENEIAINTKKTKCMIFNKTGRTMRRAFFLNGVQLECVRSYKYLGFVLTPSGEIQTGLRDLRDRAYKAYMKLKYDLGNSFTQDILTTISLIDSLIKPILLYASDFWGCLKMPSNNPVEKLLLTIYRQLLGVQKQTSEIGVLLELGTVPLMLFAKKLALKNWERMKIGKGNSILLDVFNSGEYSWDVNIKKVFESCNMVNFYNQDYPNKKHPFLFKKIFKKLSDAFHEESLNAIKIDTSKLRTYSLFKSDIGLEPYLLDIKNFEMRSKITKFRLSNHNLRIETGRHEKIDREERFCPFCPQKVEDEKHFLLVCPIYCHLRQIHLSPLIATIDGYETFSASDKMKSLMSSVDFHLYKFISNGMDLRNFLTSKPRNRD